MKKYEEQDETHSSINFVSEPNELTYNRLVLGDLTYKAEIIDAFLQTYELTKERIANILHVSLPTLYRWIQQNKSLDKQTSLTVMSTADLFNYGIKVFGSKESFFKWMHLPNTAFGGLEPMSLIELPDGLSKVRNLIGRIEHGVFS